MPYIRQILCGGLWGIPGPLIMGIAIPFVYGFYNTDHAGDLQTHLALAADYTTRMWELPIIECVLGVVYGCARVTVFAFAKTQKANLVRGSALGAVAFFWFGLPFFVLTWLMLLIIAFSFGGRLENAATPFLLDCGTLSIHSFGGAVAGFHVEYFLSKECARKMTP